MLICTFNKSTSPLKHGCSKGKVQIHRAVELHSAVIKEIMHSLIIVMFFVAFWINGTEKFH